MDLGRDESRMSVSDANNNGSTIQGNSSGASSTPQGGTSGGHPPLDLQLDPASLPPELLAALQQLDPERQLRALEMLMAEQLEQQAAAQAEEQQQRLPDEHFLTIALNGESGKAMLVKCAQKL